MTDTPQKTHRWRRRLIFVLINLVITILVLEVSLRLLFKNTFPPRFFEPDARFGHFHVPGRAGWQHTNEYDTYISINAKGLRDQNYPYEKPEGVYRILVIGDSFVEGFQVSHDQTFTAQIGTLLKNSGHKQIEVINGGVSRYGTDNTLLFLEGEGLKYHPDLVIYAFYPNDITDILEKDYFRLQGGQLVQKPIHLSPFDSIRGTLYDVSYIYRVALAISIQVQQKTDSTLIKTKWGLVLPIYRDPLRPREENGWQIATALLARMQVDTAAAGARLLVVYLPEIYQSEDRLWAQVAQSSEVLVRDAPNRRLAQSIPAGAWFFDLMPGFRAKAQDQSLYYNGDEHFNPAGHTLAADLIYAYLIQNSMVP